VKSYDSFNVLCAPIVFLERLTLGLSSNFVYRHKSYIPRIYPCDDKLFIILGPNHIFGVDEARYFKLDLLIDTKEY